VDDNATSRQVHEAQLLHAGHDVTCCASGEKGLALLSEGVRVGRPHEIVLIDFQMPGMDGLALGRAIRAQADIAKVRMVLLTSVDGHGRLSEITDIGFSAYLSKPILTQELMTCIETVMQHDVAEWHLRSQPVVTRSILRHISAIEGYSGRVLVVDDNVVNQKVAQRYLERMGCEVTIARDGLEAVELCAGANFDLVLMDVQMPRMDGFTATEHIRQAQKTSQRTPIIALTADVLSGQSEKCRDAGMDGYLSKPIEVERLREILDRFLHRSPPREDALLSA
jgi:CheY-like chemotaxis protein